MPVLSEASNDEHVLSRAITVAHLADATTGNEMTGIELVDAKLDRIGRSVFRYARDVGSPPPTAPLAHLGLFEARACYHNLAHSWPARLIWQEAGFKVQASQPRMFGLLISMFTNLRTGTELSRSDQITYSYCNHTGLISRANAACSPMINRA